MFTYPYGPGSYNTDQLQREIIAGGGALAGVVGINGGGYTEGNPLATSIQVLFPAELSQAAKATLDGIVAAHVPAGPRKPRTLLAIYTDLVALTAAQKTNVWNNLSSGSPAKYLTDNGPAAGSISVLDWAIRFSGLGATAIADARLRIASIFVQDNPTFLVHPVFDSSINCPGDQPA